MPGLWVRASPGASYFWIFSLKEIKMFLPDRESNPGLPRDRRRSSPLDYRGLLVHRATAYLIMDIFLITQHRISPVYSKWKMQNPVQVLEKNRNLLKPVWKQFSKAILRAGFEPATYGLLPLKNYSPPLYQLSYRRCVSKRALLLFPLFVSTCTEPVPPCLYHLR